MTHEGLRRESRLVELSSQSLITERAGLSSKEGREGEGRVGVFHFISFHLSSVI